MARRSTSSTTCRREASPISPTARSVGGELKIHHLDAAAGETRQLARRCADPTSLYHLADRDVGLGVGRLPRGRVRTDAGAARGRSPARHPEGRRRRCRPPRSTGDRPSARPSDQGARARTAWCARRRRPGDRRSAGHVPRAARRRVHGAGLSHRCTGRASVPTAAWSRRFAAAAVDAAARRRSPATAARPATSCSSTTSSTPLVRAGSRGSGLVVNIGTGEQTSVRDLWALHRRRRPRRADQRSSRRPTSCCASRCRRCGRGSTSAGRRGPTLDDGLRSAPLSG